MTSTTLHIIEPNPFASRLHVLGPLLRAARDEYSEVVVWHSLRNADNHWQEWLNDIPNVQLRAIRDLPAMDGPRTAGVQRLLKHLRAVLEAVKSEPGDVLFTALDDYLVPAAILSPYLWLLRRRSRRVFVIKYRVQVVLDSSRSLRGVGVSLLTRFVLQVLGSPLLCFDERFSKCGNVVALPDPWDGPFGVVSPTVARPTLGFSPGDNVVALIGRQDRRKGFPVAARALSKLAECRPDVKLMILGAVDPDFNAELQLLQDCYGDRLYHHSMFVTDAELPNYFASASLILLPYAQDFNATSGVLARAAASGVPAIVSDHGLVGFRVRKNGLGSVFPTGDSDALLVAIQAALTSSSYDLLVAQAWAQSCHASQTASAMRRVLQASGRRK